MADRSLTQRILDILEFAARPLTAAEILRRLPSSYESAELASRLSKMKSRGQIVCSEREGSAITGPRRVNAYFIPNS